ncbi:MAG: 4Fe-4S dicluster domain-containing protein [Syntrophales bacterium]|nr:4Fe-4S dicluster domain-containing protein [Syntrophales bacterium]
MGKECDYEWDPDLRKKVDRYGLVANLEDCLQCGKCTGNCPVAAITPSYNPRAIINDILTGSAKRLLDSEEIWRCMWCANCYRLCPMDINYPMLIMQLRYLALENGYGLQYVVPVNKFAFRAFDEGLTFVPGPRGIERITHLRRSVEASPWPEVSDKAKEEYGMIFAQTGASQWMENLEKIEGKQLRMSYREGRIVHG